MSSAEVFRPSGGEPLVLQGAITTGATQSMDTFKKDAGQLSGRPSTQSGYRFGHLSHNAFFARHNPHPARVRHIKGLLDVPICSVNDNGFLSNPRYAPSFPPNSYSQNKMSRYNIPTNSINVNSQLHPINTITGLQFFLGKPMNMRIFRERIATRNAAGASVNEAWQDELKALTESLGLRQPNGHPQPPQRKTMTAGSQRPQTQYSETTGRLLPPPSRAMTRGGSRMSQRENAAVTACMTAMGGQHEPESEDLVMGLLAQILQTDDIGAVQQWLVGAGDREKSIVLDLIKQAMDSKTGANDQNAGIVPADYSAPMPEPKFSEYDVLGDSDVNDKIDRLTLEPPTPQPPAEQRPKSRQMGRPRSQQNGRPKSRGQTSPPAGPTEPVSMRYTFTPPQAQSSTQHKFTYPIPEEVRPVTSGSVFRASRSAPPPQQQGRSPSHPAAFRPQTSTRSPSKTPTPSTPLLAPHPPYMCTPVMENSLNGAAGEKQTLRDVLGAAVSMDAGTQTWTPPVSLQNSAVRRSVKAC